MGKIMSLRLYFHHCNAKSPLAALMRCSATGTSFVQGWLRTSLD